MITSRTPKRPPGSSKRRGFGTPSTPGTPTPRIRPNSASTTLFSSASASSVSQQQSSSRTQPASASSSTSSASMGEGTPSSLFRPLSASLVTASSTSRTSSSLLLTPNNKKADRRSSIKPQKSHPPIFNVNNVHSVRTVANFPAEVRRELEQSPHQTVSGGLLCNATVAYVCVGIKLMLWDLTYTSYRDGGGMILPFSLYKMEMPPSREKSAAGERNAPQVALLCGDGARDLVVCCGTTYRRWNLLASEAQSSFSKRETVRDCPFSQGEVPEAVAAWQIIRLDDRCECIVGISAESKKLLYGKCSPTADTVQWALLTPPKDTSSGGSGGVLSWIWGGSREEQTSDSTTSGSGRAPSCYRSLALQRIDGTDASDTCRVLCVTGRGLDLIEMSDMFGQPKCRRILSFALGAAVEDLSNNETQANCLDVHWGDTPSSAYVLMAKKSSAREYRSVVRLKFDQLPTTYSSSLQSLHPSIQSELPINVPHKELEDNSTEDGRERFLVAGNGNSAFVVFQTFSGSERPIVLTQVPKDDRGYHSFLLKILGASVRRATQDDNQNGSGVGVLVVVDRAEGVLAIHQPSLIVDHTRLSLRNDTRVGAGGASSGVSLSANAEVEKWRSGDGANSAREMLLSLYSAFREEASIEPLSLDDREVEALIPHIMDLHSSILDSLPRSDPRWASDTISGRVSSSSASSSASASSLLIQKRLEAKAEDELQFLRFLQATGLLMRLPITHRVRLANQRSKLCAAMRLRWLQNRGDLSSSSTASLSPSERALNAAMGQAVHRFIATCSPSEQHNLRHLYDPSDVFFSTITRVDEIIPLLIQEEEAMSSGNDAASGGELVAGLVYGINRILETMLSAGMVFLSSVLSSGSDQHMDEGDHINASFALHASDLPPDVMTLLHRNSQQQGCSLWTKTETVRKCLRHQLTVTRVVLKSQTASDDPTPVDGIMKELLNQRFDMTVILLDGCATDPSVIGVDGEGEEAFDDIRMEAIHPFLHDRMYNECIRLGERYGASDVLVEVCDIRKDWERLLSYMRGERGFCSHVFKWYYNRGKYGRLLRLAHLNESLSDDSQSVGMEPGSAVAATGEGEFGPALRLFLQSLPHLSWVHDMASGHYAEAGRTLKQQAVSQNLPSTSSTTHITAEIARSLPVDRARTMFALSKLCMLSSSDEVALEEEEMDGQNSTLDEVKQYLYLADMQMKVFSRFNLPPHRSFSGRELVEVILEGALRSQHGSNVGGETAIDLCEAFVWCFDIAAQTVLTRSDDEQSQLLEWLWGQTLWVDREKWTQFAAKLSQFSDTARREGMTASTMYRVAAQDRCRPFISTDMFNRACNVFASQLLHVMKQGQEEDVEGGELPPRLVEVLSLLRDMLFQEDEL